MVNFKFAKFHCYQQIQSFLITPYNISFSRSGVGIHFSDVNVVTEVEQKQRPLLAI
jgi:hypothetical protein